TADLVYAIHGTKAAGQAFYQDIKRRLPKYARSADDLKILPAIRLVVARTRAEAQAKFDELQALLDPLVGLNRLSSAFGDLSGYPLDGPVPIDDLPQAGIKSLSQQLIDRVRRDQPTIRELYEQVAGRGGFCVIGTPTDIVD